MADLAPFESSENMKNVTIYTDGGCKGNPGPGGWGVVLIYGETVKTLCGGEADSTNNRMELMAAISALEALKAPCNVIVFADSKYVIDGITQWIKGWKARGWKTASKDPVKNVELWQRLEAATQRHKINWRWVRGHQGVEYNELADQLASEGMQPFIGVHKSFAAETTAAVQASLTPSMSHENL